QLGNLGMMFRTNASPAVPVLIQCLNDTDPHMVFEAAWSLGMIHLEPAVSVPALTKLLGHSSAIGRLQAARAPGHFRSEAVAALPHMEKLLTDPDQRVRTDAAASIIRLGEKSEGTGPAIVFRAPEEPEPEYGGKKLDEWVDEYSRAARAYDQTGLSA